MSDFLTFLPEPILETILALINAREAAKCRRLSLKFLHIFTTNGYRFRKLRGNFHVDFQESRISLMNRRDMSRFVEDDVVLAFFINTASTASTSLEIRKVDDWNWNSGNVTYNVFTGLTASTCLQLLIAKIVLPNFETFTETNFVDVSQQDTVFVLGNISAVHSVVFHWKTAPWNLPKSFFRSDKFRLLTHFSQRWCRKCTNLESVVANLDDDTLLSMPNLQALSLEIPSRLTLRGVRRFIDEWRTGKRARAYLQVVIVLLKAVTKEEVMNRLHVCRNCVFYRHYVRRPRETATIHCDNLCENSSKDYCSWEIIFGSKKALKRTLR